MSKVLWLLGWEFSKYKSFFVLSYFYLLWGFKQYSFKHPIWLAKGLHQEKKGKKTATKQRVASQKLIKQQPRTMHLKPGTSFLEHAMLAVLPL